MTPTSNQAEIIESMQLVLKRYVETEPQNLDKIEQISRIIASLSQALEGIKTMPTSPNK